MAGVRGRSGGRREGSGRPRGARNKRTRQTVERAAVAAAADQLDDPVVLLLRWANDRTKDDVFRAGCAAKAAEFLCSKPARLPERLPLPHEIRQALLEDYEKRLEQDKREHPERYGLPRLKPQLVQ